MIHNGTRVSVLSLALLATNLVHAEQDKQSASSLACNGYARAGFIETDVENNSDESAFAIGGEFGCGLDVTENINIRLGLSSSINPGDDDMDTHGDFFAADKESYVLLGEAVLNASFGNVEAHLGRQIFDSPHMDSDDLRMIPNRFEAYQLNYAFSEQFNFGGAYVRQMSGWENGADQSEFIDVGEAFGANDGGAVVFWAAYEQGGLSIQIWDYVIEDIENIFYTELVYGVEYSENLSWEIGLQYDQGREIGDEKLGEIDADIWGVSGALTYKIATFSMAHNRNDGDSGALASLGGGPFFTSMEDQTLDAVAGVDARATTFGIEIAPFDNLVFGAVYSEFSAKDDSVYDVQENNFYVSYAWSDRLSLEGVYADIDDENPLDDTDQIRFILTYAFDAND